MIEHSLYYLVYRGLFYWVLCLKANFLPKFSIYKNTIVIQP
jgi:hypothetical protein